MRCKKMPASMILSLFLSILMLLPNCMVLADEVDPGNLESPGNLTIVKYLAGTASAPPTTGFKVRVTPAGSGSAIDADIEFMVAKDITLAPGKYIVTEFETLSADIVEYSTDGTNWGPGPGNVTVISGYPTTLYIRNTFNAKTGDLNVIKSFAGTNTSPPTSGFIVTLAPSSGGAPIDKPIAKGDNLIAGLAIDNYTLVETSSLRADKVEYSADGATWSPSLSSVAVASGTTPTTVYIRNTFNIPTGDPTYTGDLNIIKVLAGTSPSPPTSGFMITLTPSSSGASINKPIASGPNLIAGLAIDNYALVETGTNGAGQVEYSFDNATWSTAPGSVPIAPSSTTIYYVRNTFNDYTPDNPDSDYTENNPVPPRQPIKVPDQPQVLEPKKEVVITVPLEPIIVPDPVPELPYTGAAGMDMTRLGLLLAAGGMVLKRFRS